MSVDARRIRANLKAFNFKDLFVEDLGWDRLSGQPVEITLDDDTYALTPVAEKRGMVAFVCEPGDGEDVPLNGARRKIDTKIRPGAHEHIIIYTDRGRTKQIWQWVNREPGRPKASREHTYHVDQPGDSLIQKLEVIAFSLEEEEGLALVDVVARTRGAFDVERVTKRFYEHFTKELEGFLKFIRGIRSATDRQWYASLMLNRLMFVYFIQKKGFLDGDTDYLRNRLDLMRKKAGENRFLSFYRHFLLRLFHEGLGGQGRSSELDDVLGKVPFLNGGLFELHELEHDNPDLQIPDKAFARLFDFFDQYEWHLDVRERRSDNEINPDVLGYIFEKYINQKQMGAYYTQEDVTCYITANTILPHILGCAEAREPKLFSEKGEHWALLQANPDQYIPLALRRGVDNDLPDPIAQGLTAFAKRERWNAAAEPPFALPGESWRDHIRRRQRCSEIRELIRKGAIRSADDCVTWNLDLRQFVQDIVDTCTNPRVLRVLYEELESVTVLDPACGSGAFLFAALNVLGPLYEGCVQRMAGFLADKKEGVTEGSAGDYEFFQSVLARIEKHPNHASFVLKTIIVNNLFGVDIMEEAAEICKLRLFLQLVAQVSRVDEVEPLPDIDFNIRAGNTLVGFTTLQHVKTAMGESLDFDNAVDGIEEDAQKADLAFSEFRALQISDVALETDLVKAKKTLRQRLGTLNKTLNRCLAGQYGMDSSNEAAVSKWRDSHLPFHWFVEFYNIMTTGGFRVIIGNPPYVETKDVEEYTVRGYVTEPCGDLYALMVERSYQLLGAHGRLGMIVPISIFGTDGFKPLQDLTKSQLQRMWVSCYANRPAQLFDGAQKRLTILLGQMGKVDQREIYTTRYYRWRRPERDTLFSGRVEYAPREQHNLIFSASLEKLGSRIAVSAFDRIAKNKDFLGTAIVRNSDHPVYYTRKFGYFLAFLDRVPDVIHIKSGKRRKPTELKDLCFRTARGAKAALAVMSSTTFFWFWSSISDCRNLNKRDLLAFRINPETLPEGTLKCLSALGSQYLKKLYSTSTYMEKSGLKLETFEYFKCKSILDEIDEVLADHFGLTTEERDFIAHYDLKYRMGLDDAEG